ncbi:19846_t:CDS:2 [Dentiscutata erythropus]|uniref:19846_t:CDS:1 n=1 Tax=Dentiscutata erythropus TaxID=1348616 RepID=A0A9N9H054_9GLOM|nr:19846_t:CDS:2 [Dentiscutata erythropus]
MISSDDNLASLDSITGSNDITDSNILSSDNENPNSKFAWLAKNNLKLNPTWEITYSWLCLAKFNNIFVMSCKYLKEQLIKRHIQTRDRQRLIKTQEESQIAKNLIATCKITNFTSLTKYYIKSNLEEEYTFEESYTLNHPLLELLKE